MQEEEEEEEGMMEVKWRVRSIREKRWCSDDGVDEEDEEGVSDCMGVDMRSGEAEWRRG